MISPKQALKIILRYSRQTSSEIIDIKEAIGRVLVEDVKANMDMPSFEKSAMDGFAIRSSDVDVIPVTLKVIENIKAGVLPKRIIKQGLCSKIMTGSPLPRGADSVVMVEDTHTIGKFKVKIFKSVEPKENVCLKGEDFKNGEILLKKGKLIDAAEIALLASIGKIKIRVYRKPTIAILATGDELVEPKEKIILGKIRNSNAPMLISALRKIGFASQYLGIAKDNISSLTKKVTKGLKSDILIISGAVSMGEFDLVPKVLKKLRVRMIFHKVAMKPGKPLFFGIKDKTLVFGLPGNPVASLLGFNLFIKLAIEKENGKQINDWYLEKGILKVNFRKKPGRVHFYPCEINKSNNKFILTPVKHAGSGDIKSITEADGFMIIGRGIEFLKKASLVNFIRIN